MEFSGVISFDARTSVNDKGTVVTFGLALTNTYYSKAQQKKVKEVEFYECNYWSNGNVGTYLTKGTPIVVSGFNKLQTYTKADGTFAAKNVIRVKDFQFIAGKATAKGATPTPSLAFGAQDQTDDLPF